MAFDPITSVVLGVVLLGETLSVGAIDIAVSVLALVAAGVGMAVLARQQSEFTSAPIAAEREPEVSPT
jgi:threonine/homoserine efflux transporter RhtA